MQKKKGVRNVAIFFISLDLRMNINLNAMTILVPYVDSCLLYLDKTTFRFLFIAEF